MSDLRAQFRSMTRRQVMAIVNEVFPRQSSTQIAEARSFLKRYLERPRLAKHVRREASDLGISVTTLRRAANELKVKRRHSGYGKQKRTWWSLR